MKSLRPDRVAYSMKQVAYSMKQTKVFKIFIEKSSLAEWKLFWEPLLCEGFLGILPLMSHACFEQPLMHSLQLKFLWHFTFKILCKFGIFCIGLSIFSWFHSFILILLLFVTVQQCCRAPNCLLSTEQNDGGFVGRGGAWKTWVRLTLLPEAQRCLCLYEVRNFTWAAAA